MSKEDFNRNALEKKARLKSYLESNSIHYYYNDNSEHVFVYNDSDKNSQSKRKGVIIIPLDERKIIKVDARKIPLDLTEQATKKEIINNSTFMDLLSSKTLRICPEDEAFQVRSSDFAKREIAAMAEQQASTLDEVFNREKISVLDEKVTAVEAKELDVNLTVLECIGRDDMEEEERYSIIKNIEDSLVKADWTYIFENSKGDLKDLASSHLSK